MRIYQLGLMLIGLSARILGAPIECFSGVDTFDPKPCDKCDGLPIEVMLILDDSSSVRYSFEKEREFAIKFIRATQERFVQTKIGAVLFSECMTGPDGWLITNNNTLTNGGWDCNTGTQQSLYRMQASEDLVQSMTIYDHGKHWGTPLSVGYDWALEEMKTHGTAGQMRVVVMTSDGLPTRPYWPEGKARTAENKLKKWQLTELCDNVVTDMKDKGIISLTLDVGGQDVQAERNMHRWASEPRDRWAVQDIVNFDDLLAKFEDILDRLCFYIDTVAPTNGDTNCVKKNQELLLTGKNLFDMGQDSLIPSANIAIGSNMYTFESKMMITRLRIRGNFATLQGAKFQGSVDQTNWIDMGYQIDQTSKYSCETRTTVGGDYCCIDPSNPGCGHTEEDCFCNNEELGAAEWFAFSDETGQYSLTQYVRLLKDGAPFALTNVLDAEFFGKGGGDQAPQCSFQSKVSGDVFYSEATEVGPSSSYTQMHCNMPNTNGVYGDFVVEMSRGGVAGTFTNNGREIRHADMDCKVPLDALIPTLPMSPTQSYFVPTPAPSSALKLQMSLHFYILFFFFLVTWI